jgi:hypothetical protein
MYFEADPMGLGTLIRNADHGRAGIDAGDLEARNLVCHGEGALAGAATQV